MKLYKSDCQIYHIMDIEALTYFNKPVRFCIGSF